MLNINDILNISSEAQFERAALELFAFQVKNCTPYKSYVEYIKVNPSSVDTLDKIPFMPISAFKNHKLYCGENEPEIVFTSSNTGGTNPSKHYLAQLDIYEACFTKAFEQFYGDISKINIYGLLPNYLQREGSSLIYMVDKLIKKSRGGGGFYLDNYEKLISELSEDKGDKILLGVSYALWDIAEQYAPKLENTIVMETGGMKGNREEIPKEQLHKILTTAFGVDKIESEYGMAELTSQAYSLGDGIFNTPKWLKILVRDINDPFDIKEHGRGGINIIDLGNLFSCAFIQTQDMGEIYQDNSFKIFGRIDHSEIRGCNLLVQ